jgi:hypothetical protein
MAEKNENAFARESAGKQRGVIGEFIAFALQNKKWWLTPIIVLLLLASALIILGGSGIAPFIYSLF